MNELLLNSADIPSQVFGKVAVVMGGWSAEREVSLMSGQQVFESLSGAGVDAHPVDAGQDIGAVLKADGFDRAFLILHGRGGEDGQVQAALELAGVPYTGTGVLGSALCMDKWRAKAMASMTGVPTPEARLVKTLDQAVDAAEVLGFPVVVKPTHEGSSIGVHIVTSADAIADAFNDAHRYGQVLLEKFISGMEIAAGVLQGNALPLVSTQAAGGFYDYNAKYIANDTQYVCPAELDADTTAKIQSMAESVFDALDCRSWARVDFMVADDGEPKFIECNTAPGMTSHSLVPIAAKQAGISFDAVCLRILADTLSDTGVCI